MSAQHTPGPWRDAGENHDISISGDWGDDCEYRVSSWKILRSQDNSLAVAVIHMNWPNHWNDEELEANFNLIRATPALLWFPQHLFNGIDTGMIKLDTAADETLATILRKGRVAVDKAEGRA